MCIRLCLGLIALLFGGLIAQAQTTPAESKPPVTTPATDPAKQGDRQDPTLLDKADSALDDFLGWAKSQTDHSSDAYTHGERQTGGGGRGGTH